MFTKRSTEKRLQKHHNFTGLFREYLFSYAIVLILPIIICSFYYYHSYNTIKERALTAQYLTLENLGGQINSVFTDTSNMASHMQLNKYISALSENRSTVNSSPEMDRYYLQKDLTSLQVSNSLITEISIYFPADSYIVSSSSAYQLSLLPYMSPSSNRISGENWIRMTDAINPPNSFLCFSPENSSYIAITKALMSDITGRPLSVLCIQIDKNKLLGRLQSSLMLDYPCCFAIVSDSDVLLHTSEQGISLADVPVKEVTEYFTENTDALSYETLTAKPLIISYFSLQIPNTALIAIADKSEYQSQMTRLLEIMLFTLAFCIILGIIVIMYYSQKNYRPVSKILSFIENDSPYDQTSQNEYHFIMQTLVQNHNQLVQQRELLKNNYLQKILSGEIAFREIPEQISQQFSLHFPLPSVCVVILQTEHLGCFHNLQNALDLTVFTVKNVYQELLGTHFADSYFIVQQQKISVLINTPSPLQDPDSLSLIEAATKELITFLQTSFQLPLCAGISSVLGTEQVSDACLQATNALEYQRLFKSQRIYCYEKLPQTQNIGSIPLNSNDYVSNLVLQNHKDQLKEYFDAIKAELNRFELSWNDAKTLFYFFYQTTARLQLYCKTHYDLKIDTLDFFDRSFFLQSLPNALEQICQAYLNACDEITRRKQDTLQNSWGKNICQFIENNYFNTNINLNTIAEHFQITPAYLSKKFREQYQKTVIDYLYEIRIENSLSLLEHTDLKITDIAQMSGFIDSNAFIRIFKKYKGITPGKYKENLRG